MNHCHKCDRDTFRTEYVQYAYCKGYTHSKCGDIPKGDFKNLKYVCKKCGFTGDEYDFDAALVR